MGEIKIGLIVLGSIMLAGLVMTGVISADSLQGKFIALDAGHGGTELGAQYPANCNGTETPCQIYEKDVNLAVVYTLKAKLEGAGANVVLTRKCDETISSRKSRVDMAIEECKSLLNGRKCDALVSVHHNGSTDPSYDGTMVIYNEKQDKPLAQALLDALVPLTNNSEGLNNGGYGMTVFGHLVSALTEAYYITNDWEANQYFYGNDGVYGNNDTTPTTKTTFCANNGTNYYVRVGDRVNQEVDALYQGLVKYFSAPPTNPGRK